LCLDPDSWTETAAPHLGSWWPELTGWLARHSGERVAPPPMGASERGYPVLAEAPGEYVFQR